MTYPPTNTNQLESKNMRKNGITKIRNDIDDAHAVAAKLGGEMLSSEYINNKTDMIWKCSAGHIFTAMYLNTNRGHWCPDCQIYPSETMTRLLLEYILQLQLSRIRPNWLINPETQRPLELDGYNEQNKIAFEYQGIQHFKAGALHRNTDEQLEAQQKRDILKLDLCKTNNVKLIVVPHTARDQGIKNLADFLITELTKMECQSMIKGDLENIPFDEITKKTFDGVRVKDDRLAELELAVRKNGYRLVPGQTYHGMCKEYYDIICKRGHIWKSSGDNIKSGREGRAMCDICDGKRRIVNTDVFKSYATSRGWEFLDEKYNDKSADKHNFKCEFGHLFAISWENAYGKGKMCKECSKNKVTKLAMLRAHARRCNITLITTQFVNLSGQFWKIKCNTCQKEDNVLGVNILKCTRGMFCNDCYDKINIFADENDADEIIDNSAEIINIVPIIDPPIEHNVINYKEIAGIRCYKKDGQVHKLCIANNSTCQKDQVKDGFCEEHQNEIERLLAEFNTLDS